MRVTAGADDDLRPASDHSLDEDAADGGSRPSARPDDRRDSFPDGRPVSETKDDRAEVALVRQVDRVELDHHRPAHRGCRVGGSVRRLGQSILRWRSARRGAEGDGAPGDDGQPERA
jgi:hypothetical protein